MVSALVALMCRLSLLLGSAFAAYGGIAVMLANPLPTAALALACTWRRVRRWRCGTLYSQGTARFADETDLTRAGMLADTGLIVGRTGRSRYRRRGAALRGLISPRVRSDDATRAFLAAFFGGKGLAGRFIKVTDYVHLCTFAPTGRGKGQSVLKPNLLTYPGSTVVVDPDAELFRDVGERRERAFGGRNIVIAPFGVPGRPDIVCDTLNPLSFLDAESPHFLDDCSKLASLIVVKSGEENEPHFLEAAEIVLTSLIAFTVVCEPDPEERTFQVIRDIASSPDRFAKTIDYMVKFGGVMTRLGQKLKWFKDRELGSVMTTLDRMTKFFDSPVVENCTASSTFDPEILRDNATLWLVLPSERLQDLNQLMRLWMGTVLTRLTRDAADESRKVLFLIDEAANIGHIPQLEEAVTLMRKRGIRLWFFFQSLSQLSKCYGDRAGVFLDNIDTQQFFGTNAYESADAISKRLGQTTIIVSSHNDNSGGSRQYGAGAGPPSQSSNSGSGVTYAEQGRALMRPEEILLADGAIIFHRNRPPILADLPLAHADPEFQTGRRKRCRWVGLVAVFLSLSWLAVGFVILCLGTDDARMPLPPLPSIDLAAWRSGIHAWAAPTPAQVLPDTREGIQNWLEHAESEASMHRYRKYDAAHEYRMNRLPVPPELQKQVTDREYVETVNRARTAAEQALRRLATP